MKKLVLVTGAGRGIGRVIALKLSSLGYEVSGCARTLKELEETRRLSENKINIAALDIKDFKAVQGWITQECGKKEFIPWGLVTAAGIYGPIGPFMENSWEEWHNATDINLHGTAMAVKLFAQELVSRKLPGRIALLSGGGATKPLPNFSSYCATKAAVVRFGETIAQELKPHGITVNSIAPGSINTRITDELLEAGPEKAGPAFYAQMVKQKKEGGADPQIAANLVAYLFDANGATITGKLIAAIWDDWAKFHEWGEKLEKSEIYTLRRILPEDRPL